MSTILKALNRLEKDQKKTGGERPLREEVSHRSEPPPHERSRPWWGLLLLFGVIGVVGVGVGIGAWFAVGRDAPQVSSLPPVASSSSESVRRAAVPDEKRRSVFVAARPARTSRAIEADVPPQSHPVEAGDSLLASGLPTAAPETIVATHGKSTPISELPEVRALPPAALQSEVQLIDPHTAAVQEPAQGSLAAPPRATSTEKVATRSTVAVIHPSRAPNPAAPAVSAAPPPMAKPAPRDVWVSRTVWHPVADRRLAFVQIESKGQAVRVREGDSVGALQVRRIEPSGVVFIEDGVEVRLGIGGL